MKPRPSNEPIDMLADNALKGLNEGISDRSNARSSAIGQLTNAHLVAAIIWLIDISDVSRWNLNNEEISVLLGIPQNMLLDLQHQAICNLPIDADQHIVERIGLLLTIWKTLRMVAPNERLDLAYRLFSEPNTSDLLNGLSIKQYLLQHKDIQAFHDVIQYLPQVSA